MANKIEEIAIAFCGEKLASKPLRIIPLNKISSMIGATIKPAKIKKIESRGFVKVKSGQYLDEMNLTTGIKTEKINVIIHIR